MDNISDKFENYYELLGVDSKACTEEIRQAYLVKIKKWHPDKNPERKEEAEEMTKTFNAAYHILSDPQRRKNYNRMLHFAKGRDFGKYVNDEAFWKKIKKASPALNQILESVRELFYLFSDAVKGRYKLHPVTLGIIGGGLLYFIIPTDFIPDFIPFVGFLDDAAILTTIINSLQGELTEYRNWKKDNE
jgi:uncharacterized membrane protein YkvA (DUF1232 family)